MRSSRAIFLCFAESKENAGAGGATADRIGDNSSIARTTGGRCRLILAIVCAVDDTGLRKSWMEEEWLDDSLSVETSTGVTQDLIVLIIDIVKTTPCYFLLCFKPEF